MRRFTTPFPSSIISSSSFWQRRAQSHSKLMQFAQRTGGVCFGLATTVAQHHLLRQLTVVEHALACINTSNQDEKPDEFVEQFIETIKQHQSPHNYDHLFARKNVPLLYQNPDVTMRITPSYLRKMQIDNPITNVAEFSGAYTKTELVEMLTILKNIFQKQQRPVSMLLSCSDHTIFAGYTVDATGESQWIFSDANQLPIKYVDNINALSFLMTRGLTQSGYPLILQTKIFAATNARDLQALLENCFLQPRWKKIHHVTPEKKTWRDMQNAGWLHIASATKGIEALKKLVDETNDMNIHDAKHWTPLDYAISYHKHNNAALLIERGADPSHRATKWPKYDKIR